MPFRKTFKLRLSSPALDDLQDIAQYTLLRYGERQVDVYMQVLYNGMELLAENPGIGHRRHDMPAGYETLNVGKHILIFAVKEDAIIIARILHQSRDVKRHVSSLTEH